MFNKDFQLVSVYIFKGDVKQQVSSKKVMGSIPRWGLYCGVIYIFLYPCGFISGVKLSIHR